MDQPWPHVFEVDALDRLLNVQLPLRAGCWIRSVPVEHPVSRVAILLDFDQQIAWAYGMSMAGWEENGIACLNGNSVNVINHSALAKSLLTAIARDRLTKSKQILASGFAAATYQNSLFGSPPSLLATFSGGCT